ncbi:MAG: NUDIX hydrolase [Candidatus Helarchaeota archaeon]|nr:NUDIX hydrolase [Candidatus Helarchaeota archaeon]
MKNLEKARKLKPYPKITVDAIILVNKDSIILIKRKNPPYKDHWAIPGGFVELGETLENAVMREAKEETGLDVKPLKILNIYSDPNRDPRGHTITVAYFCEKIDGTLKANSDAKDIKIVNINSIKTIDLAFDHFKILTDFIEFLKED